MPGINADSDVSNGSSDESEINSHQSSPPPSVESSLERLNLLDSPGPSDNSNNEGSPSLLRSDVEEISPKSKYPDSDVHTPITPILETVFPFDDQCNYNAIPSIASLPS